MAETSRGAGGIGTEPRQLEDRPALLAAMVADSQAAGPLWRPTAYWRPYCARIVRELARRGLDGVRTNQGVLKGYAIGGVPVPTLPRAAWKRALWRAAARAPVVGLIVGEYRRLLAAEHRQAIRHRIAHARHVLDTLAADVADIRPPPSLAAGGAEDAFTWRGDTVSAQWVDYLCRAADFYAAVPAARVRAILEIGPGLGLSTLAHLALNPHLRLVVNCDIPPVLYVATQFLRANPGVRVADYLDWRERGPAAVLAAGDGTAPLVVQIAPWQLPDLARPVDAAFNAFSFQEMERAVYRNYLRLIVERTTGWVCLHASLTHTEPGADGRPVPAGLDVLRRLLADRFPTELAMPGHWARHYGGAGDAAVLVARAPDGAESGDGGGDGDGAG